MTYEQRQSERHRKHRAIRDRRCPDCHAELAIEGKRVHWTTEITILVCTDCGRRAFDCALGTC